VYIYIYIYTYTHTHTYVHTLYIPWNENFVKVTVGCGISHKNTNYTTHTIQSIVGISHTVLRRYTRFLYTADNFTTSSF